MKVPSWRIVYMYEEVRHVEHFTCTVERLIEALQNAFSVGPWESAAIENVDSGRSLERVSPRSRNLAQRLTLITGA